MRKQNNLSDGGFFFLNERSVLAVMLLFCVFPFSGLFQMALQVEVDTAHFTFINLKLKRVRQCDIPLNIQVIRPRQVCRRGADEK